MAFPVLFILFLSIPFSSAANLSLGYYKATCPDFEKIVREQVFIKQSSTPATAAGLLRLFFHDCITDGCDGSILISSNVYVPHAERDAAPNLSISGDAFDIVTKIKNALELACPGTVSCSDIVAQATRDLVKMVGGPFYDVKLGRKDSLTSNAKRAVKNLPDVKEKMDQMINKFVSKSFTVREMVALTGAHTIGFSHCNQFYDRLYPKIDPTLHPKLAAGLREVCKNSTTDIAMSAFNDVRSPSKFDNAYYNNILKGLGLLTIDYLMSVDPRTKPIVEEYAKSEPLFFADFAKAMIKLSEFKVKTGAEGEIRNRCDQFNKMF